MTHSYTPETYQEILSELAEGGDIALNDDLFIGLMQYVDQRVEEDCEADLLEETGKDRLFEIFMLRFDVLNEHREGFQTLFYSTLKSPRYFRLALPQFHQSMEVMLRLADMNGRDGSACTPLRVGALALAYLNAVRVWLNDDSPDMTKTMAELDKGLSLLDKRYDRLPDVIKRFV